MVVFDVPAAEPSPAWPLRPALAASHGPCPDLLVDLDGRTGLLRPHVVRQDRAEVFRPSPAPSTWGGAGREWLAPGRHRLAITTALASSLPLRPTVSPSSTPLVALPSAGRCFGQAWARFDAAEIEAPTTADVLELHSRDLDRSVNAFHSLFLSGVASLEECYRATHLAAGPRERHGVPVTCANLTDVPSCSAAPPGILRDLGLDGFVGLANHGRAATADCDETHLRSMAGDPQTLPGAAQDPTVGHDRQQGWVDPAADHSPGACNEWFTTQHGVVVSSGADGPAVAWSSREVPLDLRWSFAPMERFDAAAAARLGRELRWPAVTGEVTWRDEVDTGPRPLPATGSLYDRPREPLVVGGDAAGGGLSQAGAVTPQHVR